MLCVSNIVKQRFYDLAPKVVFDVSRIAYNKYKVLANKLFYLLPLVNDFLAYFHIILGLDNRTQSQRATYARCC